MSDNHVRSILAADFGSVYTRAVLIDLVDGEYRLVARGEGRTTDGFPVFDLAVGFERIVRELSEDTGRPLADHGRRIITPETSKREGVDLYALSASIGRPLRAVVIGLMPNVSIQSAIRATTGTYIDVRAIVSLDDQRTEEEKLNAILLSYPDVIFLTGGTNDGAEGMVMRNAELALLAVRLISADRRPSVVYAGNQALAVPIHEMFEPYTTVLIADNLRPSLENERLESARYQLGRAFDRYKESRQKSFANVAERSQTGILSSARGQTIVAEYLSKVEKANVAIVDAGSASFSIAVAENGKVYSSIRTDLGLGHSAPNTLETVGVEALRQWLPANVSASDLYNYALNKSVRPGSIPMNNWDLYLEHAFLRAGMRRALMDSNPEWQTKPPAFSWIIGCGSALTRTGNAGYDAMLLLDSVQPAGVTVLETDPFGLIPAMGAIAAHAPQAVVQLLEGGNLTRLGIAFSASGKPRKVNSPALNVTIQPQGSKKKTKLKVLGGRLLVYPLGAGEYATVTVSCGWGMNINGKRRVKVTVEGGTLGLIFDARGRALPLGDTANKRATQLPVWVADATGDEQIEIPARWLEALQEEDINFLPEKQAKRKLWNRKPKKKKQQKTEDDSRFDDLLGEEESEDDLEDLRNVLS
jgi:uncharacterized protein (TIGR01319 family)